MEHSIHWLDVEEIAEELCDRHPDVDPLTISFPKLRELVEGLPNFSEEEGHPCNERILETIQANWIEERSDETADDDED